MTTITHLSLDAYALLLLAPEAPLGSGWLGGDKVVGRAAVGDLLVRVQRFNEDERQRLSLHLPSKDLTLGWREIERLLP